ncbi:hypothetical protein ACWGHA_11005 [Streptomyces xanthophaeus]
MSKTWNDPAKVDVDLPDLLGTVRVHPDGKALAILIPSPPHPDRWMVADKWGSCGYERNVTVADWEIVGAVPRSPAAAGAEADTQELRIQLEIAERRVEELAAENAELTRALGLNEAA